MGSTRSSRARGRWSGHWAGWSRACWPAWSTRPGEQSSSKLDIETDEHLRFAPDPLKVTMPLMAFVTDRATVAMTWSDMELQPIYATPNFFDGTDDHRMALRGTKIEATIARRRRASLEETILWAVKKRGLPPLPAAAADAGRADGAVPEGAQRPAEDRGRLGTLREPSWAAAPVCRHGLDHLAADRRGARAAAAGARRRHVRNESIYFVTGRAAEWLDMRTRQVQGHPEATAARRLVPLRRPVSPRPFRGHGQRRLRPAGDATPGVRPADRRPRGPGGRRPRTLEYMKRFRVPRGAQTWEVPAAHARPAGLGLSRVGLRARLRADGQQGVPGRGPALGPFRRAVRVSVEPASDHALRHAAGLRRDELAIAQLDRPARAMGRRRLRLRPDAAGPARQDARLEPPCPGHPHRRRAAAVSRRPVRGLAARLVRLRGQERRPARTSIPRRWSACEALDGQLDSLAVAADGDHRVVAPFPVTLRDGKAHVQAAAGVKYQVLIDGRRVVDVVGQGTDKVPLDGK